MSGVVSEKEDGEYWVIVVDENNNFIIADSDAHSSGPPSLKDIMYIGFVGIVYYEDNTQPARPPAKYQPHPDTSSNHSQPS
jgi:hypothetical protein